MTADPQFFTPLPDSEVPDGHKATLTKYRGLATAHGVLVPSPVCYLVRGGFTLKSHAPMAGLCYERFAYLQDWKFLDEPTVDSIVFWVPQIFHGSFNRSADAQLALLAETRNRLELPAHHLSGFGTVGLVAGLVLAHHRVTGERVPPNPCLVRTDTNSTRDVRLSLRWAASGLLCNGYGNGDIVVGGILGMFALGVEPV